MPKPFEGTNITVHLKKDSGTQGSSSRSYSNRSGIFSGTGTNVYLNSERPRYVAPKPVPLPIPKVRSTSGEGSGTPTLSFQSGVGGFDMTEDYKQKKLDDALAKVKFVSTSYENGSGTPQLQFKSGLGLDMTDDVKAREQSKYVGLPTGYGVPQLQMKNSLGVDSSNQVKRSDVSPVEDDSDMEIEAKEKAPDSSEPPSFLEKIFHFVKSASSQALADVSNVGDFAGNSVAKASQERAEKYKETQDALKTMREIAARNPSLWKDDDFFKQYNKLMGESNRYFNAMDPYINSLNIDPTQKSIPTQVLEQSAQESKERMQQGAGKTEKFIGDALLSAADMGGKALLSSATGLPFLAVSGVESGAQSAQNALSEGYDANQAVLTGVGSGLISAGVESLGGIGGKTAGKAFGKLMNTSIGKQVASHVSPKVVEYVQKAISSKPGQVLTSGLSEGAEELIEYDAQRVFENIVLDKDTPRDIKEQLRGALLGAVVGSAYQGTSMLPDAARGTVNAAKSIENKSREAYLNRYIKKNGQADMRDIGISPIVPGTVISTERTVSERPLSWSATYSPGEIARLHKDTEKFRNVVVGADISAGDFYDKWKNGRKNQKFEKLYLGKTTPQASKELSKILGYDVGHRDYIISNDDVSHIFKHHSSNETQEVERGQVPITREIFNKLPAVVRYPDRIYPGDLSKSGKLGVVFEKQIDEGTVVYVQFDNTGRGTMQGKTLYVKKIKSPTSAEASENAAPLTSETTDPGLIVKPPTTSDAAGNNQTPNITPAASSRPASNFSIPHENSDVNTKKASDWLRTRGLQLPKVNTNESFSSNSIPQNAENVNQVVSSVPMNVEESFRPVRVEPQKTVDYDELIEKYGAFQKGESPRTREIKVPQKTDNGNVTRFARTIMESDVSDAVVSDIKNDIASGERHFVYEPISDKAAINHANSKIEKLGYKKAKENFHNLASNGGYSKYDVAFGERLLKMASSSGDTQSAVEIASDLSQMLTNAGQSVQAGRILKKMSPEGQLTYIQSTIAQLNSEIEKRTRGKGKEIELPDSLADELLKAKNEAETYQAVDKILKHVAGQIPADWAAKWDAWRYLAMLANPKTHIRNILGNTIMMTANKVRNTISGGVQTLPIYKAEKTRAILTPKDKALKQFAKQDYDAETKYDFKLGGKYSENDLIRKYRRIYKTKALENVRKLNSNMLDKEDEFFSKMAYVDSMARYMKANGYTADYFRSGTPEAESALEKARNHAWEDANKAVFKEPSKLASNLNRLSRSGKFANVFFGGNIPFTGTPINMLKRGVEYSPVGLLKGVYDAAVKVRRGDITASQAIDEMASGLTGTGVMLLGYWLSSIGMLSAGPDDGKEDDFNKLQGAQNYSLNIGDYSYTIDWLAPLSMPLFVGAELRNQEQKSNDESVFNNLLNSTYKITDPIFELSMLQGINDAIQTAAYSDNPIGDMILNTGANYITQGVPTLFGQAARTIDGTRRSTYTSNHGTLPKPIQLPINKVFAKTPGLSFALPVYVDVWGRTDTNPNIAGRIFENFISPGYLSKKNTTEVDEEVEKVYQSTSDAGVLPRQASSYKSYNGKTYYLQPKELADYQTSQGQYAYKTIDSLRKNAQYNRLTQQQKGDALKRVYDVASEKASTEFFRGRKVAYKGDKYEKAKMFGNPADYYIAYAAMSDVKGKKDDEGKTIPGSVKEAKINALIALGYSEERATALYEIMN